MSKGQHLYCLDLQQQYASKLATIIVTAERPCSLIPREGNKIRLVPKHERLTQAQMQQQLLSLMSQPAMTELLQEQCQHLTLKRPARHVAAWLRGCCYLSAGNCSQALRDARTALAYAAQTAVTDAKRCAIKTYVNPHGGPITRDNTAGQELVDGIARDSMPVTAAAPALQPEANQQTRLKALHPCSTQLGKLALKEGTSQVVTEPPRPRKHLTQPWFPAALLAGQAYAELGEPAQAALHLAEALTSAPEYASALVRTALHQAVRNLPPDQAFAWVTGGCEGLRQQLRDEADQRLPEVLRPRPKWYYYNQWTRQRIHLTLLELQLAHLSERDAAQPSSLPSSTTDTTTTTAATITTNNSNSTRFSATSTSSTRGRLLLDLLSEGGDNTPLVTAAAAAAGFQTDWMSDLGVAGGCAQISSVTASTTLHLTAPTPQEPSESSSPPIAPDTTLLASSATTRHQIYNSTAAQHSSSITAAPTATRATPVVDTENSSAHTSAVHAHSSDAPEAPSAPAAEVARQRDWRPSTGQKQHSSSSSSQRALQLPDAVVCKLLSMDAGDLDLMLQHPCALQAQVYELLDVLQEKGAKGLEAHTLQPLSWEEVQLLSGPGTVGLPLGYSPLYTLMPPPSVTSATLAPSEALLPAPGNLQEELLPGDPSRDGVAVGAIVKDTRLGTCDILSGVYNEGSQLGGDAIRSWRQPGWTRVQYIKHAAAASTAVVVRDAISSGHTIQAEG